MAKKILTSLICVGIILFFVFVPLKSEAVSILTPFGGRVQSWLPDAPGCSTIERIISLATLGTVNITIEELRVGASVLGFLNVDDVPIMPSITPGVPNAIYRSGFAYRIPKTAVLGNSINVCDICKKLNDVPGLKSVMQPICNIGIIKTILEKACGFIGSTCPITNLVFDIGSGARPSPAGL